MIAMPAPAVAIGVAVLIGAALACLAAAVSPRSGGSSPHSAQSGNGPAGAGTHEPRIAIGIAVGFLVLLISRWPVLAATAALLTIVWPQLMRDAGAEHERRRIEGIAKWLEDLRDTLRGSSVGAEEALEQVALRPPAAIRDALATFTFRRRQGFRVEDALVDLADELDHPTSDAAIAAIRLVVGGTAGAGRLHHTVSTLAAAARDEVRARERVDRTRAIYHSSMKRLIVIAIVLIAYLKFAAGDLLDAYGTPAGQVVLMIPLAMWAACVLWLRSLCRYEAPTRYRIVGSAQVHA
jgi:hypothetical protein